MTHEERARLRAVRSNIRASLERDRVDHLNTSKDTKRVIELRRALLDAASDLRVFLEIEGRR